MPTPAKSQVKPYVAPPFKAPTPAPGKAALTAAPLLPDEGTDLITAYVAEHGPLPTKHYDAKKAFGHTYASGTYTDHLAVKSLVWALRSLVPTPSYRTISEALGIQCSALTEAVTHSYAKTAKVADGWQKATGGRVKVLAEAPAATA